MKQMSNEKIDELYKIASRLKVYNDSSENYLKIQKNAPSHSIYERYVEMLEEYTKALNDFDYFVSNYVKFKGEN